MLPLCDVQGWEADGLSIERAPWNVGMSAHEECIIKLDTRREHGPGKDGASQSATAGVQGNACALLTHRLVSGWVVAEEGFNTRLVFCGKFKRIAG